MGKTTTCANLGIGLAQAGKRVLLVDADPQGSLTLSLGSPTPDKLPVTLATVMGKTLMDEPMPSKEGILHHAEGVDLMPANIELSGLEVSLVNAMSREKILKQYLDTVKREYDYILIDCMPSLGMLTINALAASDSVLIPVQAQYLPAKGLEQLFADCRQSAAADQSQAAHRRDSADNGGQPHKLRPRGQRAAARHLRQQAESVRIGHSAVRPGGGDQCRGQEHLRARPQRQGCGSVPGTDQGGDES